MVIIRLAFREDKTNLLFPRNQDSVADAGSNQDKGQDWRASVPNLIGYSEHHARQDKMDERASLSIRELKKRDH
jgi:hypothetical protein